MVAACCLRRGYRAGAASGNRLLSEAARRCGIFWGAVVIARDGTRFRAGLWRCGPREEHPRHRRYALSPGHYDQALTGLAIGQLVEQGKLSYDDPLSKFLPDDPDAESAKRIKIKHLLSHTSGLGRDFGFPGKAYSDAPDRMRTVQAWVDTVERKRPRSSQGRNGNTTTWARASWPDLSRSSPDKIITISGDQSRGDWSCPFLSTIRPGAATPALHIGGDAGPAC